MPTEHIKYTDNLRKGTDKLNKAIDAANSAENLMNEGINIITEKTDEAVSIATTAADNADEKAALADQAAQDANSVITVVNDLVEQVEGWEFLEEYDPAKTYEKNNMVYDGKSTYISLQDGNTGNAPATSNQFWGLLARGGVDGMGAVASVNTKGPDEFGDITLSPTEIGAASIQELYNVEQQINSGVDELTQQLELKANQLETAESLGLVNQQLTENNKIIKNDINNKMPKSFTNPTGFSFSKQVLVNRNSKGEYSTNIQSEEFKPIITGATYYADIKNGSNSNDGLTPETAFKTPYYAQTRAGVEEIIVMEGVYDRNEKAVPNKSNMIIRAMEGHEVIFGAHEKLIWSLDGSNTYKATRSAVNECWDGSLLDENGMYTRLNKKNTLQEVKNSPNSWYTDGNTVYVHTHNRRIPDNNLFVSIGVNTLFLDSSITGDFHGYLEGIRFLFGTTANLTAKGPNSKIIAKNCEFNYAGSTNGLSVIGFKEVILENCKANNNRLDGFNYHASSDGLWNGEVIEINCEGRNNGWDAGSNNGSSIHEAYKAVRVGGHYHTNRGANIADVNNSESWNVGVVSGNSIGYNQDFYGNKIWLDSCYSNSKESLNVIGEDLTSGLGFIRSSVLLGSKIGMVSEY